MRFIFMFALAITFIGCGKPDNYELDERSFGAESLKMIERKIEIKLPDGSRGLRLYYKGEPMDPYFAAKIKIPKLAQEAFIGRLKQLPNHENYHASSFTEKIAWWKPSKDTIQVERLFGHEAGITRVILCKEDDGLMFYVLWAVI